MSKFSHVACGAMATALLIGLTGCGGGGGSDDPPQSGNPPAPAPTPPPPPPPPPPASPAPPIASTAVNLSAGPDVGVTNPNWGSPLTDGNPIGGFNCVVTPPDTYSVRAHVTILLNGAAQRIPKYVGAAAAGPTHCFYPVHTDDASGRIHVVAAAPGTYTLGQLFQFWGQPLTNTNVAGFTGLPVEVWVTDGTTVTKVPDTEWSNIELTSHREITIGVGTPVTEIPNYTWTD